MFRRTRSSISASIAGRVIEAEVADNQEVKAGQVLFKLDPVDELTALHRARRRSPPRDFRSSPCAPPLDQQKLIARLGGEDLRLHPPLRRLARWRRVRPVRRQRQQAATPVTWPS